MVFHNRSNYDYQFIINGTAKLVEVEFDFPGEKTEKYKNFSAPVTKWDKKIDKKQKKNN